MGPGISGGVSQARAAGLVKLLLGSLFGRQACSGSAGSGQLALQIRPWVRRAVVNPTHPSPGAAQAQSSSSLSAAQGFAQLPPVPSERDAAAAADRELCIPAQQGPDSSAAMQSKGLKFDVGEPSRLELPAVPLMAGLGAAALDARDAASVLRSAVEESRLQLSGQRGHRGKVRLLSARNVCCSEVLCR